MPFWPLLYLGADPFGAPVLRFLTSLQATAIICRAATEGLIELTSAHDDDLVPWDPEHLEDDLDTTSQTYQTLVQIRGLLQAAGVGFHTMTCNLHSNPIFKNGGLANPDPKIRELAWLKVRRAVRVGAFLGARKFTYWVARDGFVVVVKAHLHEVYQWIADGLNAACEYIKVQEYTCYRGGTIEPKPNEPTGHSHIPTAGHAVGFIWSKLDDPQWWRVNPELLQHEGMTLLNAANCVAYLVACDKLSFLHLGNQIPGHEDNDFPPLVGPGGLKETAQMFWVLLQAGWKGVAEFDCHPLRSEVEPARQEECLLQFIRNCSNALAVALLMANRLQKFMEAGTGDGMGQSQADVVSTADMCGISREAIELWTQRAKQVAEAA
jgi:xylose isomerase